MIVYSGYDAYTIVTSIRWYLRFGMGIVKNNTSMTIPPNDMMNITHVGGDRYYQLNKHKFFVVAQETYNMMMKIYILGKVSDEQIKKIDGNWGTTDSLVYRLWLFAEFFRGVGMDITLSQKGIDFIDNYEKMIEDIKESV